MNKTRNSSLDLLRIIAMFMVVLLHLLGKGGCLSSSNENIKHLSYFLEAFSIGAVNIYVLISGYFLYDSKFSWKKVVKLWSQVLFYSLLFFAIFYVCGYNFTKKDILFSIFPVMTKQNYWFVTCYLFMYIMSPFLNVLLINLNKKQHFHLCLILFLVFPVISVILPFESLLDATTGYGIIWFIIIYIFASYLKKYKIKFNKLYILGYLVLCLCIFLIYIISQHFNLSLFERFYRYNSFFVFTSALCIFIAFNQMNIKNKKVIKSISFFAPLTFGVYLIHENILVRQVLYDGFFKTSQYGKYGILCFLIILIIQAFIIFISCSLFEYIRVKFFLLLKKIKKFNLLDQKISNMLIKLTNVLNEVFKLDDSKTI